MLEDYSWNIGLSLSLLCFICLEVCFEKVSNHVSNLIYFIHSVIIVFIVYFYDIQLTCTSRK